MNQGLLNYQKLMQQMNVSPEGQEMAAQGGDMINTLNHQQTAQMPPQPSLMQRMGQGVKDFTNDKEKMAVLANGLNSLRLNPDPNMGQMLKSVKDEQMQRMKQEEANKTLKYFHDNGRPDLVEAVQNGYPIKDAISEFRKFQQGGQTPAAVQTFNNFTNGMNVEDVERAKRINLGLEPRAVTNNIVDVGGVPHVMDRTLGKLVPAQIDGQDITAGDVADNKNIISSSGDISDANTQKIINAEQSILTSKAVLGTLDAMLGEHKEAVMSRTGGFQGRMPVITENQALGQSYIDQVMGQSFMEAYKSLKGSGQITEVEGNKAAASLQRLGTQTMSDDNYMDAIQELRDIAAAGLHRSQGLLSNDINNLVNMYAD